MNKENDLLSVSEVALILNFSERYIRDLLNKDKLKGGRVGKKGKWLVERGEVKRYKKEEMGFVDEPQSEQKLESEAGAATTTALTHINNKEDPIAVKGVEEHFVDIHNMGNDVIKLLDDIDLWAFEELGPEPYSSRKLVYRSVSMRTKPMFESLKLHVPESMLWDIFDWIVNSLVIYLFLPLTSEGKEHDKYLQSLSARVRHWNPDREYDTESRDEILEAFLMELPSVTNIARKSIYLLINRGKFPGICPLCPVGYQAKSPD